MIANQVLSKCMPLMAAMLLLMTTSSSAIDIVFFNQDCNVDAAGADNTCSDERANLLALFQDTDNNISLLSDFDISSLGASLAAGEVLVIPDLEDSFGDCNITDTNFLSDSAKTLIASFVTGGGDIMVTGSVQNIGFINDVFGLSLVAGGNVSTSVSTKNVTAAANTPFESCPDELPNLSATFLVSTSMPSDKRCVYETGGLGSVAYFPFGAGSIIYLGYDFNDSGASCTQSASEWITCVLPAAEVVVDTGIDIPAAVPTLSQWMVIVLGLITMSIGVVYIRSEKLVKA